MARDALTDENVFTKKEFQYGSDARSNVGYPNTTTPRLGANASAGEISAMRFYGGVAINRGLSAAEVGKTGDWLRARF